MFSVITETTKRLSMLTILNEMSFEANWVVKLHEQQNNSFKFAFRNNDDDDYFRLLFNHFVFFSFLLFIGVFFMVAYHFIICHRHEKKNSKKNKSKS